MKTIIFLTVALFTYFHTSAALDVQTLEKGKCVVKTINASDTHVYKLQLESGNFVSIFLTENNVMLNACIKNAKNNIVKEFVHSEGSVDLSVLEFYPEENGEYTIEIAPMNFSGLGKYCIDFKNNISKSEKFLKDQPFDVSVFENYYFNFELNKDRTISIGPSLDLLALGNLTYFDSQNNRFGILHPLTDSTFYSPYSMYDKYSNDIQVTLHKTGGKVTSMSWVEGSETMLGSLSSPFRKEKVAFNNGDVKLRGMLMIPEGEGPFPAVVLTQCNAAPTRQKGFFISYLLSQGIAVLSFDKRGTGESSGNWIKSSYSDLKNDLAEGMNFLKNHQKIDQNNIGLFGISQGGLISYLSGNHNTELKAVSDSSVADSNSAPNTNDLRKNPVFCDPIFKKLTLSYYDFLDESCNGMPYNYNNNYF